MGVDRGRLLSRLSQLSDIGRDALGGVSRLALSDEDQKGRDLFVSWLKQADLDVAVDDGGTIVGTTKTGQEPALLLGSHIDSVREGGRYDGALGVLGALAAVEALMAEGAKRKLGVVSFTSEEGARFRPALLGSGLTTGGFAADYVHSRVDDDGKTYGEELRRIGYAGSAANRLRPPAAFLELHIEQGPRLEAEGYRIGVVSGIVGMRLLELTVRGRADHAGPTPMRMRCDALVAAARVSVAVRDAARAQGDDSVVATVGRLHLHPNVSNVIPSRVEFNVDIRGLDKAAIEAVEGDLRAAVSSIAREEGCEIEVQTLWDSPACPFDPVVVTAVREAAAALSVPCLDLWSGASHDARMMAEIAPTAMVFVPCKDGISHNPKEFTTDDDCVLGAEVLLTALHRLDQTLSPLLSGEGQQ